jgi:hypothetical protein
MVKARDEHLCAPAMTILCCAACLHAITEPQLPVRYDGRFFHAGHLPVEARAATSGRA